MNKNEKHLIGVREAAKKLAVSRGTFYRLMKEKDFPRYKIGGRFKFIEEEIDLWIKKQKK